MQDDIKLKSDIELMLDVKYNDNEKAYDILVERYMNRLLSFFFRMLGNQNDSEDLSQQTFLRLYTSRKSYKPNAKFSTYIYTIASNLAKTSLKQRNKRKIYSLENPIDNEHTISDVIETNELNPYRQYISKERLKFIYSAINSLPRELYLIFTLSEDEGMSYKEIAKIVNIPEGTVASRKNTAVKFLRKKLEPLRKEILGGENAVQ